MLNLIKLNSKGLEVRIIQTYLNITADGIFGKKTQTAVNKWQQENGLTHTGIITSNEWKIIAEKMPTIKKGIKSKEVKIWQLFLGVTADGDFGTKTQTATRSFQLINKLAIDGVVGPKTWYAAFVAQNKTNIENKQPVNYKQYDSRWGSVIYTKNNTYSLKQTIKSSGCGPTSMADIVATWWDNKITPVEMAKLAVKNGYRTENSGTAWDYFSFCAKKYGASKFIATTSIATLKEALNDGAYAIVSFGPSKWTNGG